MNGPCRWAAARKYFPARLKLDPTAAGAHVPMFREKIVTPDDLQIMSIPVLRGRAFTEADSGPDAQAVVIVSRTTAEHFWPGKDAVGEHFRPAWEKEWCDGGGSGRRCTGIEYHAKRRELD